MAGTKSRKPTLAIVAKWIRLGFGQGVGRTYKPFMFVRDVPSVGSSNMVRSRLTGRTHHYLSELEFAAHLLAEYSSYILDIREQFALLPWAETQLTATQLGIRHPAYEGTTVPIVMTTDLVLSLQEPDGIRIVAISVKPSKDLDDRTFEKLLLERLYWNKRGVTWMLATEKSISQPRAKNLAFFERALQEDTDPTNANQVDIAEFALQFEAAWQPKDTFIEILHRTCQRWAMDANDGHLLLGKSVWNRCSRIDLDAAKLAHSEPVALIGAQRDV